MTNPNSIDVIVVVSGENVPVDVNTHQKVAALVREALHKSGNEGQPLENWILKFDSGTEISFNISVADAGITDGAKLFLNPKAGEGGER